MVNKTFFSGHVRVEVYDTDKNSIVYEYESDNKIIPKGLQGYGSGLSMLAFCRLGRGFVPDELVPRKQDGTVENGWVKEDGLYWFYQYGPFASQNGTVTYNNVTPPLYRWVVLSPAYQFALRSFDGEVIDCVFLKHRDQVWSVVQIPRFIATASHLITVYYRLTIVRDVHERSYQLNLGPSTHTVTCKPARIYTEPFTSPYMTLQLQRARVWHYTDVTSLGDVNGEPLGTNFNCPGIYRDYTFDRFIWDDSPGWSTSRSCSNNFSVTEMNCAPNGISGFLVEMRYPILLTQYKIDPPIMKNENMELSLSFLYNFFVDNVQVG